MKKLIFAFTLGALFSALINGPAPAGAEDKIPRVGILFIGGRDQPHLESFKQGLCERGYTEGKNIILVYRYAEGAPVIRRQPTFVAIYRRDFEVRWLPLTAASFRILTALAQGQTMDNALHEARGPIQRWFQSWMAAGLFQSVKLP